jgi:hypothetical protein
VTIHFYDKNMNIVDTKNTYLAPITINPCQTGNFYLLFMPSDSVGGVVSGNGISDSSLHPLHSLNKSMIGVNIVN